MIGSLIGLIKEKTPSSILLEVSGIGYEIAVPLSTSFQLPNRVDDFPLLELTRDSSTKSKGVVHRYFKSDGGIILIKGSRAMKMERFTESITQYLY